MPVTLDQVFIPACQQMLASTSNFLDKARDHAEKKGISTANIFGSRLAEDMWPLPNQIQSMWVHSAYAIEQVKAGEFRPNVKDIPTNWDEMKAMLVNAWTVLDSLEDQELDKIADEPVYFVIGDKPRFKFTTQNFLLSFSMPNVHFHATTAYDILRMRGVKLGKFDFLGKMRTEKM